VTRQTVLTPFVSIRDSSIFYFFNFVINATLIDSEDCVDVGLSDSNAVWTCRNIPTFRRDTLPPPSVANNV
jgi:hypothetical protein